MVTPDTVPAKVWAPSHHWRPRWPRCVQTGSSNWENLLKSFRAFLIFFVTRQARAEVSGGRCRWALCLVHGGVLDIVRDLRARFRAPAAGAPPPGSPPQMGTSGSQRRGFRPTRAGAGGVPAVGGRGGVLVPLVARSAVSALRGWSGKPHKSVEIRWNGIGVVQGWSPPRTGQVCERISAQTPWIQPESKIRV
jgi:hypothetical protein